MKQVSATALCGGERSHCPSSVCMVSGTRSGASSSLFHFHSADAIVRSALLLFQDPLPTVSSPLRYPLSFLLNAIADSSSPGTVKIHSFYFLTLFSFPVLCLVSCAFERVCACIFFLLTTRKDVLSNPSSFFLANDVFY